jgi:polygalacturonase
MRWAPLSFAAWAVFCPACGAAGPPPSSSPAVPAPGGPAVSVGDFGARGDGRTLDTAAIQRAIDAVPAGGTLRFPPGVYRIEADKGLLPKDDMRIELGEATLVADNVDKAQCRIFLVRGRKGIAITGGTLVGSRSGAPAHGMGIFADDSQDLLFEGVTLRNFYVDGIILTGNTGCRRVTVRRCTASGNRRTGLAIVHASDVTVEASTFETTRGQSPESGLNVEPNPGESNRNIRVSGSTFAKNGGVGAYVHGSVADVAIQDSVFEDNGADAIVATGVDGVEIAGNRIAGHRSKYRPGIAAATGAVAVGTGSRRVTVADNTLDANLRGIFCAGVADAAIRRNTVVGTGPAASPAEAVGGDGIVCQSLAGARADACVVANNTVRRVAANGVVAQATANVQVLDNVIEDPGQRGILLRGSSKGLVRGNTLAGGGAGEPGRYDAVGLEEGSNDNVVTGNTIHMTGRLRSPVGVAPGCTGNQVTNNVVLPY